MITMLGVWTVVLLWVWVTFPLLAPGVWPLVDLPAASIGQKAPATERDRFVSIRADGRLFLNEQPVTFFELVAALSRREATGRGESYLPDTFVRVDRSAPFRAVRSVMKAAQTAGQPKITILARPAHPGVLLASAAAPAPSPLDSRRPEIGARPAHCRARHFFVVGAGVDPPVVQHHVNPQFGGIQQRIRVSRPVLLELFIEEDGTVCAANVVEGLDPSIDGELARVVKEWKFKPARWDGHAVACIYKVTMTVDTR